jgi:hypothetical protein
MSTKDLLKACEEGKVSKVKSLLENTSIDINFVGSVCNLIFLKMNFYVDALTNYYYYYYFILRRMEILHCIEQQGQDKIKF